MEYDVELTVNGAPYKARVPAGLTLMRMLRDELHLGVSHRHRLA